jgi:hypothetical protein
MHVIKTAPVILILYLLSLSGHAQKWGKISDEELSMTYIGEDPEADAVYLFDKGSLTINKDFTLTFERYYRIKVLAENGKEFANQHITYYAQNKIYNLEAQAISPDGSKYKLDDDNIFEQEFKSRINWKKKTFAIPGVEVGSVIECKYRMLSDNLYLLPEWSFQNEAFTLHSEISADLMPGFNYTSFTTNMGSAVPQPIMEEILIPGVEFKKRTKYTWQMKNIPALKTEPYVKGYDDYFSAIYFQLTTYNSGYQIYNFTKTWDALVEDIIKNYKSFLEEMDEQQKLVNTLCPDSLTILENVKIIYHYVQKEIETNNKSIRFFSEIEDPKSILEKKEASAANKNLLLIYLFNHLNIPANPVFICTRDEGSFITQWISVNNFNHLIVEVIIDNKKYYLDTQEKYCPFGALPEDCLVREGLRLTKGKTEVIKIPQPKVKNERNVDSRVQILENGDLKFKTTFTFTGIIASDERYDLNKEESGIYLKNKITKRFSDAIIDTFTIAALEETDEPLTYTIEYHAANYLQENEIYRILPVPVYYNREENPFIADIRRLPIDFGYTKKTKETISIELPTTMQVIELPQSVNARLTKISFSSFCSQIGNTIKYTRNFNLGRLQCAANEYNEVKRLYRKMVEGDQAQILLNNN